MVDEESSLHLNGGLAGHITTGLPTLTPGNMKITDTFKHFRTHPSVAAGQRLRTFLTASD